MSVNTTDTAPAASSAQYGDVGGHDALLFVSFGGPESPEEVMPFLQRVTAGRGIPDERLRVVGQHYYDRGGVSPINQLNRDMIAALEEALGGAGITLPVYWGNRNAAPFLDDAVATMAADGIGRALAFVTSAYGSYSGCRQYRENLAAAQASCGAPAPAIEKLRLYYNHPGFIEPFVDGLRAALATRDPAATRVFFTAHSLPMSAASSSSYVAQLHEAVDLVTNGIDDMADHELVWQSRSGPPSMPWLEPDIVDAIEDLPDDVSDVIVVPIGFVSDHMEVIQDLDTAAAEAAAKRGLGFERIATPGTDPRFIAMIVDLVAERLLGRTPVALGDRSLEPDQCSETCCPAPRRPR